VAEVLEVLASSVVRRGEVEALLDLDELVVEAPDLGRVFSGLLWSRKTTSRSPNSDGSPAP
jgi:hypothetical protein